MILSEPQRVSGEAFAIDRLKTTPDVDFATLRAEAAKAGIALPPLQYGRARKQLNLPPLRDGDGHPAAPARTPTTAPASAQGTVRKGSPAFDFLLQELRREPGLAYAELRSRAEGQGFSIAPIMYGRAKAVLGLVPVKPRGSKAKASRAGQVTEAPVPSQLRQVESVAADRFAKKLDDVRSVEQLGAIV
jgi:hypothetical protein